MGDNVEIFLLIILVIVIIFFIVSIIVVYNKLTKYRTKLSISYNNMYSVINKKIICLDSYFKSKNSNEEKIIKNRLKEFPVLSTKKDIINSLLDLDRELNELFKYYDNNGIDYKKLKKDLNTINNELVDLKKEYNDNVLRFNNLLKMFPISLISSLFGFSEWHYYRND